MSFPLHVSTAEPLMNSKSLQAHPIHEHKFTEAHKPKIFQFKRHDNLYFRNCGLWRIQEGFVRTLSWSAEGDPVPLGFWQQGDIIGYTIAQARPYEAQCLMPVVAEYLGSTYSFSREVALAQVSQSNDLLRIAHCRQADKRLLLFLCWLAQRFGKTVVEGREIQPRLTHQEIADSIGSTRVTITRLLKELEREGKIRCTHRQKIVRTKTFEQSCEYIYSLDQVG